MAAWHPFVVAGMHLFAALDRDLREALDLTLLDHGILLMVRDTPAGLTMGHLAQQFGTEASVLTYRIQPMERRAWPSGTETAATADASTTRRLGRRWCLKMILGSGATTRRG